MFLLMYSYPLRMGFRALKHCACANKMLLDTNDFCSDNWPCLDLNWCPWGMRHCTVSCRAIRFSAFEGKAYFLAYCHYSPINQFPGASLYDFRLCSSSAVKLHSQQGFWFYLKFSFLCLSFLFLNIYEWHTSLMAVLESAKKSPRMSDLAVFIKEQPPPAPFPLLTLEVKSTKP